MANRISEPGTYDVMIIKAEMGKSQAGNDMLTVTFSTEDGREIRSWFVNKPYPMERLAELKTVAGLATTVRYQELLGKKISVVVGLQDPTKSKKPVNPKFEGIVFMEVKAFLPVTPATETHSDLIENLPF